MPRCQYCDTVPYLTYCASYFHHIKCCRKTYERANQEQVRRDQPEETQSAKKTNPRQNTNTKKVIVATNPPTVQFGPVVINNVTNNISVVNNVSTVNNVSYNVTIEKMYVDYPKNDFTTNLINLASRYDVKRIQTRDDYNKAIIYALEANGGQIEQIFNGDDSKSKSQALSFMADYSRTLRRRLEAEKGPQVQEVIEDAKEYENELLQEKNQITC